MSHILTLVASSGGKALSEKHVKSVGKVIEFYNLKFTSDISWLDTKKALEIGVSGGAQSSVVKHLRDELAKDKIDFFITPNTNRQKKLLLADMDSTIASTETLDELAEFAGIKDQISAITERAMEGELDFHTALRERIGLLKGLETSALEDTLEDTDLNPGAEAFAQTMRAHNATCVLVSGGFTFFTENIGAQCGFHHHHGNVLEIAHEALTGNVIEPILDKHAKVEFLDHYIAENGLTYDDCLTIGDGANDLPMLKKAGLGIGYHPKDTVKSEMHNCILHGDLTAALYAQGYTSEDFADILKTG